MKLISALLFSSIVAAPLAAGAQTPAPAKPHVATHAAAPASAGPGCVKLFPVSPKVPAVPAGSPCAKAIYTLTTNPQAHVSYAMPGLADAVADYLGIAAANITLAYVDTKIGTGAPAEPHKWYRVLYTGYLPDGTVFDSSAKHPEMGPFVLQQGAHGVIPGWDFGFVGMKVGGKRRLFIPFQLGYSFRGSPDRVVPPNTNLVFDIELVSQSDKDPSPPAPKTAPAAAPTSQAPAPQPTPAPAAPPAATVPPAAPPKP